MARLNVWYDIPPLDPVARIDHRQLVEAQLSIAGVRFERIFRATRQDLQSSPHDLLRTRARVLAPVLGQGPYQGWPRDLVVDADPSTAAEAGLDEHSHASDEVRIWLHGSALLSMHHGGRVLQVACGPGDLVVLPAGLRHWLRPIGRAVHACLVLRPDEEAVVVRPSGTAAAASYPPHTMYDARCRDLAARSR